MKTSIRLQAVSYKCGGVRYNLFSILSHATSVGFREYGSMRACAGGPKYSLSTIKPLLLSTDFKKYISQP